MTITLDEAQQAIAASIAKAKQEGVTVGVAIVDPHGDIVAVVRMDNPRYPFLPQGSLGKAMATALWGGTPTSTLEERAAAPIFSTVNNMYGGRLVYSPGAVPIKRGDEIIGAIGVGGAPSGQLDEDIAAAGAAVVG